MSSTLGTWALLAFALYGLVAAIERTIRLLRVARARSSELGASVVVLVYNRADQVEGVVDCLAGFCRDLSAELLLLDLESTDETPLILERLGRRHAGIRQARLSWDRACESALFLSKSPAALVVDLRQPVNLAALRTTLTAFWK